jgi:hypothetical protein
MTPLSSSYTIKTNILRKRAVFYKALKFFLT